MNESKLPLIPHFTKLREQPKWGLKFLIAIIMFSLSSIITVMNTDMEETYKELGMSSEQIEQTVSMMKMGSYIGSPFMALITIGITFLVFLLISKIMKSTARSKSIFSATLSYIIITTGISFIVSLIQLFADLSPMDYTITSLNIFDKGNKILGAFDLQTFVGAYVFGVIMYATNKLSKKSSIIWAVIYLIVCIGYAVIGATLQ